MSIFVNHCVETTVKSMIWQWLLILKLLCLATFVHADNTITTASIQSAQDNWQQGNAAHAIEHWQQLLQRDNLSTIQRINISLQLAHALHQQGLPDDALMQLQAILNSAKPHPQLHPLVLSLLADLSLTTRQYTQARDYADAALTLLQPNITAQVQATVLNYAGHVSMVEAYYRQAMNHYQEALMQAQRGEDLLLQAKILTNLARAYFKSQQTATAKQQLHYAEHALIKHPDDYNKAFALLSIAQLGMELLEKHTYSQLDLSHFIYSILQSAQNIAASLDNAYLTAYAYGYLGRLYELQKRYAEAQQFTRQAIFYAQQGQLTTLLYRWEWQLARLLQGQGQLEAAIQAYQQAVNSLQQLRQAFLATRYRNTTESLRDTIGAVYFNLADLLLKKAAQVDKNAQQKLLKQAQQTIERFKVAELQDYFGDDCVAANDATELTVYNQPNTAVIYPILLQDRTEILLNIDGTLTQLSVPSTATELKEHINEFRFELETRDTQAFLPYAQRLYQLLIDPLKTLLRDKQIKTLVFIPDATLRTMPLAALHDGKQFLIQQYAVITLPNLQFNIQPSTTVSKPRVLINGLSVAVQGYSALESINDEVKQIEQLYAPHSTVLLNQAFTTDKFAEALRSQSYDIVHIASHGQFDSDPRRTFLLTYDSQLSIDKLEKLLRLNDLRNESIELLTLSACQTAVGDDQAALGLAGIAIKAGARNALASLWFVDDTATALLISEFYRQLQVEQMAKADALQIAQQKLLSNSDYQHPFFWAAFLLIGHWL